jgi:transcriptional regulator with XRE-family HTH domain
MPMTFAQRLRQLRDQAGLSEAKLAQASGVSFASIHEYGSGRRKPSFEAVVKIARALGVSVAAFADEDGTAAAAAKPAKRKRGK